MSRTLRYYSSRDNRKLQPKPKNPPSYQQGGNKKSGQKPEKP